MTDSKTNPNLSNLTDIIDLEQVQTAYINGRYLAVDESLTTFEDINPATGEVLATIQQTTDEQINEAVIAAQKGQKVWAAMTPVERSRILLNAVAILRERNDVLALLEPKTRVKRFLKPNMLISSPVPMSLSIMPVWHQCLKVVRFRCVIAALFILVRSRSAW